MNVCTHCQRSVCVLDLTPSLLSCAWDRKDIPRHRSYLVAKDLAKRRRILVVTAPFSGSSSVLLTAEESAYASFWGAKILPSSLEIPTLPHKSGRQDDPDNDTREFLLHGMQGSVLCVRKCYRTWSPAIDNSGHSRSFAVSMTVAQARQYLEVIQSLRADQIGPLLSVRHPAPDLTMATELSARLNQAILRPQRPVIPRAARAGAGAALLAACVDR